MGTDKSKVLQVRDLHVQIKAKNGITTLVQDINFELKPGEILGLIGESGCGKTVTSMSILQLLNRKETTIEGSIMLKGQELNGLAEKEMRKIRGKDIAFIMQNPMNAFTPVFTIGHQFVETIRSHTSLNKKQATELAIESMKQVNLPDPGKLLKYYPFQLSGGMLQRVMIAIAASLHPAVIIADEPTTALDVNNQKNVLRHLDKIRSEYGSAILLISHDLGVVSEMADEVAVMQHGKIVEKAGVFQLFDSPKHEYTKKLLNARPSLYLEEPMTNLI
ncbi:MULTISPECIES: nickel import ATP-binding protein NikD [Priestia]|uniref:Nickel transport system ATP-binding protein n=1 Tax=Priestia aryabhattai TaxID=412384 RepID=A0A7W3RG43_PRIAR|nr:MULTISPECIES: nickel import ATP-binding protein NikD [Priestia]KOP73954.1 nickel ABC transporter ATP-binding protein [Bacillus sp. FJAT-21351]MBA9039993.1 nickel transport system ATP-binding protein [Priestia aryabhattai]MED3872057.1 nickel import ATP-binding protein NikD [Priestia megaterium]MED4760734.1 nickel import ATP-binding protein NikD [Priestia megaterium]PER63818.1 nickel import ATP-binding protein NikD [Priestia megaterium]